MAGGASGAASGAVLGLVGVILAQQFGYIQLTDFQSSLILLLIVMIPLGVVFGLVGRVLRGRAIKRARGVQEWKPPAETPSAQGTAAETTETEPTAPPKS